MVILLRMFADTCIVNLPKEYYKTKALFSANRHNRYIWFLRKGLSGKFRNNLNQE